MWNRLFKKSNKKQPEVYKKSPIVKPNRFVEEDVFVVEPIIEEIETVVDDTQDTPPIPKKSVKIFNPKYHVSQNKDKDANNFLKWRIRKESSNKTIQYFDTQKQAIDHAKDLADKAGSAVVIHKLDGSIRRQDYKKKD